MLRGLLLFLLLIILLLPGFKELFPAILSIKMNDVWIVFGGTFLFLLVSFKGSDIVKSFKFLFDNAIEISKSEFERLLLIYQAAGAYFIFFGIMGAFINFIELMITLNDKSELTLGFALSLIPVIYGVAGKLTSELLQKKLKLCTINDANQPEFSFPPRYLFLKLALFLFITAIAIGINPSSFFDLFSLVIIIVIVPLLVLIVTPRTIVDTWKTIRLQDYISTQGGRKAIGTLVLMHDSVVCLVFLVSLGASIGLLSSMDELTTIGPKIAVFYISAIYGTFCLCVIRSLFFSLRCKLNSSNEEVEFNTMISDGFFLTFLLALHAFILIILLFTSL